MPETQDSIPPSNVSPHPEVALPVLALRGAIGGVLMGLANLVPGISGGTMLLAAGVYTRFVGAIAELSTLRFRVPSLVALGSIAGCAALAILTLAGPTKTLVVEQRWIMYSLFIGLTLGGVPVVWRLARPLSPGVVIGALVGFGLMILLALSDPPDQAAGGARYGLLFTAGVAGASAMILPGVSGGYLLLLLGQYVPILSAVDVLKLGLQSRDTELILQAAQVVAPVGIGVLVGVVGVSNLVQWFLRRYSKPTLGFLLGLLFGAILGLWPFQQGVQPEVGEIIKGSPVTLENRSDIDAEDWPVRRFSPEPRQVAASIALIFAGLGMTLGIARLGRNPEDA